jgi:hypothetical protein
MQFAIAVANWRRAFRTEAQSGWRSTCGSAERLYAGSPERHQEPDPEPTGALSSKHAEEFEALVAKLNPDQRLAWHIKNGFRPAEGKSKEWIDEHSTQARAQLSVWWFLSHR